MELRELAKRVLLSVFISVIAIVLGRIERGYFSMGGEMFIVAFLIGYVADGIYMYIDDAENAKMNLTMISDYKEALRDSRETNKSLHNKIQTLDMKYKSEREENNFYKDVLLSIVRDGVSINKKGA